MRHRNRKATKRTDDLIEEIRRLSILDKPWPQTMIAAELGLSQSAVQKWAKLNGIPAMSRSEARRVGMGAQR